MIDLNKWREKRLYLSKVHEALTNIVVNISFACTKDELETTFKFVHDRYLTVGLIGKPEKDGMWITPFHVLDSTKVATARLGNLMSCTATAVMDSEIGLPCEEIYHDEVQTIRDKGGRVTEFCSFAALPNMEARNTIFYIFRLLFRYVTYLGATDLFIAIRPRHANFYEKILLFERLGGLKRYPKFDSGDFFLEHLDLKNAPFRYEAIYSKFPPEINLYEFFVKRDISHDLKQIKTALERKNMSFDEIIYFFKEKEKLIEKMPKEIKDKVVKYKLNYG